MHDHAPDSFSQSSPNGVKQLPNELEQQDCSAREAASDVVNNQMPACNYTHAVVQRSTPKKEEEKGMVGGSPLPLPLPLPLPP